MERFGLIVFDWDGTLVDSTAHIAVCIQKAFSDTGLPVPDDRSAKHVIGLGLTDTFNYLCPDITPEQHNGVIDRYKYHFLTADKSIKAFDYVAEGLQKLADRQYLLAVATGKSRVGLDRALKEVSFGHQFVKTRCGDEGFPKPHPDMLHVLMDHVGVSPAQTLMIGDTTHDLELARNAGAFGIGVSYGAHPKDQLQKLSPLACVDDFPELIEWIEKNN